ncbi:MAG: DUF4286 family protein [Flavobacteriales bacterium]|nr:DUF4286 family protein [Flavobacteriales bacterium]
MKKIYNITFSVDSSIENEWIDAVQKDFIPTLLAHQAVRGVDFIQVNTPQEMAEQGSSTFTIQLGFDSQEMLDTFLGEKEYAAEKALKERFGEKYLTFRLVLNNISSHKK